MNAGERTIEFKINHVKDNFALLLGQWNSCRQNM